MERHSGFDDDDDDEEFGAKRDGSSHKEFVGMVDGKNSGAEQRPNTPRSKHSATEQRRRSKINDRFQILRELIPHSDQKRDKASFLLEVIEYVRFLQEKAQKYESSYPGWTEENAKLMPWNNSQGPGDGLADPSQVIKNGSAPSGLIFSGHDNSVPVPQAMVSAAHNPTESDTSAGTSYKATENSSGFVNADNMASQSQAQCLRSPCPTDCTVAGDALNEQEELAIDEGTISVSSAYSQGMLTTLSQALQSSGIDLSQANISVIINLGKRAANRRPAVTTTMSSAKDHDDPSFGNRAIGHSRVGSSGEESEQASKRHKLGNS